MNSTAELARLNTIIARTSELERAHRGNAHLRHHINAVRATANCRLAVIMHQREQALGREASAALWQTWAIGWARRINYWKARARDTRTADMLRVLHATIDL